jgi:hypothetical protein
VKCTHEEGRIERTLDDGTVEYVPVKGHDCRYVDARNGLLDRASQLARQDVARAISLGSEAKETLWIRSFLRHMDELAKARGIVK